MEQPYKGVGDWVTLSPKSKNTGGSSQGAVRGKAVSEDAGRSSQAGELQPRTTGGEMAVLRDERGGYVARIGDDERRRCIEIIHERYTSGHLTHDECEARTAAAGAAKTHTILAHLMGDLPGPSVTPSKQERASTVTRAMMRWLPARYADNITWRYAVHTAVLGTALMLFLVPFIVLVNTQHPGITEIVVMWCAGILGFAALVAGAIAASYATDYFSAKNRSQRD